MRHFTGNGCFWLVAVLLASVLSVTDSVAEGFYVGVEAGFSKSGDMDVSQSLIDHPTRCDSFLYPSGATPPMDAECTTEKITTIANVFAPGAGFAGGVTLGYAFGNGLRFEAEYLNRRQGSQRRLARLGPGGGETFDQKESEWDGNDPPSERVYDLSAHHFFLNAYYDLRNASPFTPYIGGGIGVGSTEMRYSARFLRRSDLGPEPWQMAASGTVSDIDTKLGKTRFGFQVVGGVDYALGDDLSVGAKVRWTRLSGFDRNDVSWTRVRGHEPIRADGVTPLTTDFEVGDADIWTFTVGLKYYL
ncbi:MAG: porin family protein [Candidatus Dadabacteria bacterium]|nr:porin family protein [Candidatus Dadabacteria bacterium]MYA48738.1 porin family protein [Candidatus Dadabacteria bacterium]MYF48467.1 porin family protein [Candidatus Dadabacteria bacterium]MYG83037.1 porin family protein [Candidatus Dadabacteria bacterium]MYK49723.1 porin family protein [Candidatus Dadabacteria bacterium]